MPYLTPTAREEVLELAAHIHPELLEEDAENEPADEAAILFVFLVDLAATYVETSGCDLDTTLLAVTENLVSMRRFCANHFEQRHGRGSADMGIEGTSFAPGTCSDSECIFNGIVFWITEGY